MTTQRFAAALAHVLRHEGGYVDHPRDPGGATNHGITLATLQRWRGVPVDKAEVRGLTRAEAALIYRALYWDRVRAGDLPAGVDLAVFDAAVNSGPDRAVRWLQQRLDVPVDGRMGPQTLAAAHARPAIDLIDAYSASRLAFLQGLPTFDDFGRGWTRRVRDVAAQARRMATTAPALRDSPEAHASPHPRRKPMDDTKPLLQSRTLWANIVGLLALALPFVGAPPASLDTQGLADAIPQAVAAVSFIASSLFRVLATRRIGG